VRECERGCVSVCVCVWESVCESVCECVWMYVSVCVSWVCVCVRECARGFVCELSVCVCVSVQEGLCVSVCVCVSVCACMCEWRSKSWLLQVSSAFAQSRKAPICFVTSASQSADISAPSTGRISAKFYENKFRNSKFGWNRAKISGTVHKDLSTFSSYRWIQIAIKELYSHKMALGSLGQTRRYKHQANAVQCYVMCTLPILLTLETSFVRCLLLTSTL